MSRIPTVIPILIAFCIGFQTSIITQNGFFQDGQNRQPLSGLQFVIPRNNTIFPHEAPGRLSPVLFKINEKNQQNSQSNNLDMLQANPFVAVPVMETVYDDAFRLTLPDSGSLYSSIRVSSLFGMNFASGRNICVKPDHSKNFFVYSEMKNPGVVLKRRSGFNFGWQFHYVQGEIPSTSTRVYGTTIILSPAYTKHVTHFAESSIPMWHALSHPSRYPVHSNGDRIFLKQSNFEDELEWNQKILSFLSSRLNATIIDVSSFRSSSLICFENAGMVGMGLHEFGFFANEAEARSFRRSIIVHYHVTVILQSSLIHKSRCLILQRRNSRRLENRDDVVKSVEETGLFDCSQWSTMLHGEMEKMSFREQLSVVASTQFLVGLHGSGLVNSIFLSHESVAVDLLPDNYLELEWHNFASKAGVRFYFMFLRDTGCSNSCRGHIFETSKVSCRSVMRCNHKLLDFKLLQVIAAQADFHIRVSPNIRVMDENITYSAGLARKDNPLLPPIPL